MAKINPCFKRTFVFFNSLFAIFGIVVFILGLFLHQYVEEVNGLYAVITLYVIGSIIFIFSVLGAYGAYKESKCALIVFFVLMCLATAGTLRVAVPVAVSQEQIISHVNEMFGKEIPLKKEMEGAMNSFQAYFQCCGLLNGYEDWKDEVPESCNCMDDQSASCEMITTKNTLKSFLLNEERGTRKVWSQPCGPLITEYLVKVMIIMMVVCFSLAALAILGGVMSLAMIIRISAPASPQTLPTFSLSYQPPKYSEVADY